MHPLLRSVVFIYQTHKSFQITLNESLTELERDLKILVVVNNESINEFGISFGLGLPVGPSKIIFRS